MTKLRSRSRVAHLVAFVLVVGAGVWVGSRLGVAVPTAVAVMDKLRGRAPECPWRLILSMQYDTLRWEKTFDQISRLLSVLAYDSKFDIELISFPARRFWIKRPGRRMDGQVLLNYLLADHEVLAASGPENVVRPGDLVLDCGAHVGVYTYKALELGAARVIAVEPDPVNLECLRRNFVQEIASGRVLVVPKGVWSSEGTLKLSAGTDNSGTSSFVLWDGGPTVEVPLTTIDNLLRELKLDCVTYIKMDIEGAEREALRGALKTLRRCRPRIMLDTYHLPDDMTVLPAILREAHPGYAGTCMRCERSYPGLLVPHVVFYR